MKSINEVCLSLSIDLSAFRRTLQAAINLTDAKKQLSDSLAADFEALRAEGLTDKEEQALKIALAYSIGVTP